MGPNHEPLLEAVRERVRVEGPLKARDFEQSGAVGAGGERKNGPWWDWKPAKAALEYLWRTGELAIVHRSGFEKVYDLMHRALPEVHALPSSHPDEHIHWACESALDTLGVATPRELAQFWGAITGAEAGAWCKSALGRGEVVVVWVDSSAKAKTAFARPDWRKRAKAAPPAPIGIRLLSPFDPLIRDRARALRLFKFEYRFEAFVPEAKRKYGYYVLPILESDGRGAKIVGRLDPKFDRFASVLRIRGVWWEPGVKTTRARVKALDEAIGRYAAFNGAKNVEFEKEA